ncbi:hypothetical protein PTTG_30482, partial [Puccinia triticina 1-1 BBBD Race 1]
KGREALDDLPEETTFQPCLTGRAIGSLSNNWRRTEPPPHVNPALQPQSQQTGQVDLNSLIAEMRFQRELDQARLNKDQARREEDRARREAEEVRTQRRRELDESAKTSAIINTAINKLDPDDILKPDGSNVRRWEDALCLTAFKQFNNQHFFTPSEDLIVDPYFETIACGIIHSSVHSDLSYNLVDFENSAAVYEHLLLAKAIAAIDQCTRTFREQGVTLTWDTIVSFVFQGNLRDHLGTVVDRKVNLFMETHNFELPLAGDILRFWEAARTEHRLAKESGRSESSALAVDLASQNESSLSGVVSGPQEESSVSVMALDKPQHCYICKQTGHFAPNCPTSQKNNQPLRTMPHRPTGQQNFPPCSITYNFDRVPYIKPIQPDSRTTTSKPTTFRQHNTPHSKPADPNATKKAVETRQINPELFAKEEEEAEFVFENENLSAEPSGH